MTNLFKKLMLVAVAAMAFTACSQDVNEVNKVEKVTRYEFTANIADDTRSGFAEKEEGAKAYKSEWYGDETLKIFVADNNGYNVETTATVDAKGNFDLELTDAPESFFITVVSPAESWVSEYTANIPTEQTPLANSVDPKAHLLQAQAVPVSGGVADINMNHLAAYGKMTVNAPEGFVIDNVVINLVGTFFGYDREYTYTINADNVDNNTFWFATEPIDVAEFTVTAYDAEGKAVAKTVDVAEAGKTMSFAYGRVGTFSVSNLEAVVAPEEPKALVFTSAKWVNSSYSDKLVQFYTEDGGTLQLNWYNCGSDAWIVPNTYGFASSGAIYYGGEYSWYENTTAGIDSEICTGTVVVSVVAGQYYIEFKNLADWDGTVYIENATFTGLISGLQVPDMRTALAKPTNVQVSVVGRTISVSWDAVDGAEGYLFELYYPYDEVFTEIVEGTSFSFTGLNSLWNYYFKLSAYASDENPNHRNSEEIYLEARTEDTDPKMEVNTESLKFKADGETKEIVVTLKNFTADITVSHGDNEWLTLTPNGNVISVSVAANDVYEKRFDTIVVTAGEFTKEISVEQAAKKAEGTANSNIFTQCKCVNNMDMGEGWGAKFELSNDEGLFLWLWVIQTSVNQSTGAIATGTYNFHNEWCDYATQPGFVVKKMRLPGSDEEIKITNATMKATLNGAANDLEFGITLEDGTTETYTFSGTVVRAW